MGSLLQNPMFIAMVWLVVLLTSFVMGSIWMIYLIKIVMNDDEIQEKIRKHKRINEEIIRAQHSNRVS